MPYQKNTVSTMQRIDNDNDEDDLKYSVLDTLYSILGKEGFELLIESYVSRATNHLQLARQYIKIGDMDRLHFVAHTLKGSSANLGANNLANLCASLDELALQATSVARLHQQLILMENQFAKIETLLFENIKLRID